MATENQPKPINEILKKPFEKFSKFRWQTKLLILGGLSLVIASL